MSNGIDIHIAAVGDSYTVTVDGLKGPTTYMVTYDCWNRDSRKSCDEMWQNETDSPRAWGYCPSCGKRRQAIHSRVAGSDS